MTLFDTLRRSRFARISLTRREPTEATAVRLAPPPEPPAAALPEGAPRLRDWIGVLAMGTGLFMAIMDVQIVCPPPGGARHLPRYPRRAA